MKQFFLATLLSFITLVAMAQSQTEKNNNQLNFGMGISTWGVPVYVGYGHGIGKDFTIGLETSLRFFTENSKGADFDHTILGILGNVNYHFNRVFDIPNNVDLYAGISYGVYSWTTPPNYSGDRSSEMNLSGQVGARYFLSKNVGLNLEASAGDKLSGGKFGLTFRL